MIASKFVKLVRKKLREKNVSLNLIPAKWVGVEGRIKVNGYFDEEHKSLVCAIDKPYRSWLPILVHEYGHFEQWKKQCKPWTRININGEDRTDAIFLWIKKKRYRRIDIKCYAAKNRELEVDCERRTVRNIRKFKLPIDVRSYIQQANSYLYFYNYALLRRRWWKSGYAPYDIPEVWTNFPTTLKRNYSKLPQKYVELYDKYC